MSYDIVIFEAINGLANHTKVIDLLGIFLAQYLPYILGIFLLSLWVWPKPDRLKNKTMVLVALISAGATVLLKTVITFFYHRARPYVDLTAVHKLISMPLSDNLRSFPSGHTLFFFAISTAVYCYHKKLGIFFFVCSALIGLARIFVGVHWPSDILGGALLGVMTACMVQWCYKKIVHHL